MTPTLQTRKLRPRELKFLAPGHVEAEWGFWKQGFAGAAGLLRLCLLPAGCFAHGSRRGESRGRAEQEGLSVVRGWGVERALLSRPPCPFSCWHDGANSHCPG